MSVIEAYVCNLGKYVAGNVDGGYLRFPSTTEDVQALLKRIGVDGIRYEEVIITEATTEIEGLSRYINQYADIDELNYLTSLLDDMEEWELEKFTAAVDFGEYNSVKDLINLAQNLDCFEFYPGIEDEEDLGRFYIEEMCTLEVPEHLEQYIDYEAYGRDMNMDEDGHFTDGGYVVRTGDSFAEHYNGRDIPDEYRIFSYPAPEKASIRDTLKMYQKMIDEAPNLPRDRPAAAHDDR